MNPTIANHRFEFGENWQRFLAVLDEERIRQSERSLREMLEAERLDGLRFLDVGCGSGLSSLAARRLGASVVSFDVDPQSVACAQTLRERYLPNDPAWRIEEGSALDETYLKSLGTHDLVYSWGVLHHSGRMWQSLANVAPLVAEGGKLWIAIYNDQGRLSRLWLRVKRSYAMVPQPLRPLYVAAVMGPRLLASMAVSVVSRNPDPARGTGPLTDYKRNRGMSRWHDLVDWVGGYPFEVAKPEQIFEFFRARGFSLVKLRTVGGALGCNEFVFERGGNFRV